MKKYTAFILTTAMIIGSLTACSTGTKEPTKPETEVTTEAAAEVTTEAVADESSADITEVLETIYSAAPGTAGSSEKIASAADAFVKFAFANGEGTSADAITLATEAFFAEKLAENEDYVALFEESFGAVCDAALEADESIEEDVSYLKFVNGIDAAIENAYEGDMEEGADITELLEAIYSAEPGSAGSSLKIASAAEAFTEFVFANGEGTSADAITYATKIFLNEKSAEDESYVANFTEAFEAVCDAVIEADDSIETDTSYLKFVNGISEALENMAEEEE